MGCAVALLAALVVGVGGAGGHSLDTTTLLVEVIGGGQISGGGGQIDCGAGAVECYATYVSGTSVTLTATASGAWSFDDWGSGCSSQSGTTCTITLDGQAHEVIASFAPTGASPGQNTLNVSAPTDENGNGGEVADGSGIIDCGSSGDICADTEYTGSTLSVLETPDPGYQFDGWGGACSGTGPVCTVTLSSDQSITASFSQSASATTLTVTVTGNGTVSGGGIACTSVGGSGCTASETAGSNVTLTATPAAGAGFAGWGGACAGSATTCVVTMDSAKLVTAAFNGGASGSTEPVVVAVVGNGSVTGSGIDCGGTAKKCTVNVAAGSSVTLTATAASGGLFTGWSGSCTGAASTCTVTVAAPTSVTATFSGGTTGSGPTLSVSVRGPGTVSGGGIDCGGGASTCSATVTKGSTVTLTATPQPGATFDGWAGACHGTAKTCRLTPKAAVSVSATFGAAGAPPPPPPHATPLLRSRGKPLVRRTELGFTVTLRFRLAQARALRVRALRAGRAEAAFSFTAPAGPANVGPFPLAKPGYYRFEIAAAGGSLHWTSCLGRCGPGSTTSTFAFSRRPPDVKKAGREWSVALRFRSTVAAGVELRVYRGGKLARDVRFAVGSGAAKARPVLLSPGGYSFKVVAIDAYGRVRSLTWIAVLP